MTSELDIEKKLRDAFVDCPPPMALQNELAGWSSDPEKRDLYRMLSENRWSEVDFENAALGTPSIFTASDQVLVYFLPGILIAAVINHDEELFALVARRVMRMSKTVDASGATRFFTSEQREAISSSLKFFLANSCSTSRSRRNSPESYAHRVIEMLTGN